MTDPATPDAPTDPPADPPAPPSDRTFRQDEVDRIVQERLARERQKYGDYDELKAAADKLRDLEQANQTELEKAQAKIAELEQTAAAATQARIDALLRSEITTAAMKLGAADAGDVFALLPKDAVTVSDDGSVTGAEDAVKALLEAKPHLVGKAAAPRPGSANGGPQPPAPGQLTRDDLKTMTPEQIVQAKAEGRLNDLMSGRS